MSKLASYMGFARKSKNLVTGTDTCIKHMEKGRVKLLIIAGDTSDNTMKKLIGKAEKNEHYEDIIVKEIDSDKSIEKEVF